jgi:hypothetical protein
VSLADDVSSLEERLYSLCLNWKGVDIAHVSQSVEEPWLQSQRVELLCQLLFITRAAETHKDLPTRRAFSPNSSRLPGPIS